MTDYQAISASILEMTKALAELAQGGDLAAFQRTMEDRERLVRLIEAAEETGSNTLAISANLAQAKALNDELISQFNIREKKLLDEKSALNRGEKMRKAYGDLK